MKQGRWSDGAKLLENLKSANDENNYQYAQNRCMCYLYSDNISKAIESLQEMNAVSLRNLKSLFSNLSQLDWESYWTQNSRERLFINNLVANQTHSSQAIGIAYDNALYSKNLLVNFNRIIDKFVAESSDENLKKKYVHNKYLREQLAYKSNKNSRDSLLREIMNTEKSILANINIFGDKLTQQVSSWQEVRESLNDDEIAIEYSYAPVMEKYPNMKPNYSAFVLRKDF